MTKEFEDSGGVWKLYKVEEIFTIATPKRKFNANTLTFNGVYPYVARGDKNNGVRGYITEDSQYLNPAKTISFGQDTATMFYQKDAYFTGDKIKIFSFLHGELSPSIAQFIITAMKKSFSNFTWGSSSFNEKILKKTEIVLPTVNNKPAIKYMDSYIKALEAERIETLEAYLLVSGFKDYQLTKEEKDALEAFDNQQWQEFRMGDLFDRVKTKKLPYKAKELPKEPQGEYSLPALTSSFMNQGLNYYVPKEGATVLQNVISIPSNSDVYRAYFQSQEFTVLSDAYAIDWIGSDKQLRPNDYLFIVPSINKVTDLPIYSYKNKLGGWNVVKDKLIKLPVNKKGEIHFDYMATLVQAIKKLVIKDVVLYADKQIKATKEVVTK